MGGRPARDSDGWRGKEGREVGRGERKGGKGGREGVWPLEHAWHVVVRLGASSRRWKPGPGPSELEGMHAYTPLLVRPPASLPLPLARSYTLKHPKLPKPGPTHSAPGPSAPPAAFPARQPRPPPAACQARLQPPVPRPGPPGSLPVTRAAASFSAADDSRAEQSRSGRADCRRCCEPV
jgi:hypothetical protein